MCGLESQGGVEAFELETGWFGCLFHLPGGLGWLQEQPGATGAAWEVPSNLSPVRVWARGLGPARSQRACGWSRSEACEASAWLRRGLGATVSAREAQQTLVRGLALALPSAGHNGPCHRALRTASQSSGQVACRRGSEGAGLLGCRGRPRGPALLHWDAGEDARPSPLT